MWLSVPPGSDVVDWLYHHVEGFQDRREARKYASNLLKAGFIRHTVNKITFSEQCYYIFGDFSGCENCKWGEGRPRPWDHRAAFALPGGLWLGVLLPTRLQALSRAFVFSCVWRLRLPKVSLWLGAISKTASGHPG